VKASRPGAPGEFVQTAKGELKEFDGWEGPLKIESKESSVSGRAMVAKCYGGEWLSVTMRKDVVTGGQVYSPQKTTLPIDPARNPWVGKIFSGAARQEYAAGQYELCEEIANALCRAESPPHGLIVISGTTGCSKSTVARHAICRELAMVQKRKATRRAHLVTLEDPIEKPLALDPIQGAEWGIDCTPRALGRVRENGAGGPIHDCRHLAEGLRNALRMTPSAFYIGETRDAKDWSEVLKFAGTGHFVLTTTHAGSLGETFKNILRAVNAQTAADRAAVADKLIAVMHLAVLPLTLRWPGNQAGETMRPITLPQIWRRTPGSAAALVVDGLSSIQPVRTTIPDAEQSCFARVSFVRPLLKQCWNSDLSNAEIGKAEMQVLQYELSRV
jgi:hypothetical protein